MLFSTKHISFTMIQPRGYALQTILRCYSNASGRKRLVILGTGWGSYAVLKNINKKLYDVIVISPRNHFLFTPLLCSTTVGTLEFRSIIEPVRNSKFRTESHFHLARAISVDAEKRLVKCCSTVHTAKEANYDVPYDELVIGVGAKPNTFNVPGVMEYAFFLKEISDARKIRNHLLSNFEAAVLPNITDEERKRLHHIVIVGGGPTGVEFGAEIYDFVQQDVKRLYADTKTNVYVTLVEANEILGAFDDRLRKYAEKKIRQRENFSLLKDSVAEVMPTGVKLRNGDFLPCGLVVWSTGIAPQKFTADLPYGKNKIGQIITTQSLKVKDDSSGHIYALGDCADIENMSLPCTAQVAEREGRYLAGQLNGKPRADFQFQSMGMLAYIGDFKAVGDLGAYKAQGFSSWLLWRSAYLTRLGSWRLRMQVPMDWSKTLLFGRDTSRFE